MNDKEKKELLGVLKRSRGIYKINGIYIIIMAVHHGALDIQLMVIGNSKVNGCYIRKYCYQYDHAALSRILDGLSHSDVVSAGFFSGRFFCICGLNHERNS